MTEEKSEEKMKNDDPFPEIMGDFLNSQKMIPELFENEYFKKLQKQQNNAEQIKNYFDLLNWAVREKFKVLATISSLSATLLIVATFNERIIILTHFVRWILFALLLLIPISLCCLLVELYKAEHHGVNNILQILRDVAGGKEIDKKVKEAIRPSIRGWFTWILGGLFTVVIIIIAILVLLPIFQK
ncbi:MAG TPA: hypothetical protein P5524_00880 [Candidatus Paceibacterota bacterium]|nr:hypothetical protein [Candidatus Paceibacterota bacterium]